MKAQSAPFVRSDWSGCETNAGIEQERRPRLKYFAEQISARFTVALGASKKAPMALRKASSIFIGAAASIFPQAVARVRQVNCAGRLRSWEINASEMPAQRNPLDDRLARHLCAWGLRIARGFSRRLENGRTMTPRGSGAKIKRLPVQEWACEQVSSASPWSRRVDRRSPPARRPRCFVRPVLKPAPNLDEILLAKLTKPENKELTTRHRQPQFFSWHDRGANPVAAAPVWEDSTSASYRSLLPRKTTRKRARGRFQPG